jgi:HPt (histidine-containing phosphotransfer) domain-containing protein
MDLQMPEVDGLTATGMLRANPRFRDLPILAMTAHALVEERERCFKAGMNDHVTKPIDPDTLFAVLEKWAKPQQAQAPVRGKSPGEAGNAAELVIPMIDGVDVAGGLKRVAGNKKLFRSLLEQFVTKQANSAAAIAQTLEQRDLEGAERLAHTVKGVAGNLGIATVQRAAGGVEKAIRDRDGSVTPQLSALQSALATQIDAIRAALGDNTAGRATVQPFDKDQATAAIHRLRLLIEANDGDAADAVDEVAAVVAGEADAGLLDELRKSVSQFDFETARTKLSQIASSCHLSFESQHERQRPEKAHSAG